MAKQQLWASTGNAAVESGAPASVDHVDKLLEQWIASVLGNVPVTLTAPQETHQGVNLYLLDLASDPSARSIKELPPHRIALRYLITTYDADPYSMHRMLGELVFAAMNSTEFQVEMNPLPAPVWRALGVVPRPSFVLRVPLARERPEQHAPLVRTEMVIKSGRLRPLHGSVLGPGDVAILGAQVELPGLNLSTATDFRGRFHFPAVPCEQPIKLLYVRAKGRTIPVRIEKADEPISIHLHENQV